MIKKLGTTPVRRAAVGGAVALGATALAIATVPAFADSDQSQPKASCEAEPLLEDEDIESISGALDASGSWAAGRVYQETSIDIRLWNDGEVTDLEVPGDAQVFGINGNGTAVGVTAVEDKWESVGWAHHDGEITEIALADDDTAEVWPRSINDDGVVAGYSMDEDWNPVSPVRWDSVSGEAEVLPVPEEATSAAAEAIDADGSIVGWYEDSDEKRPYRWDADGNGEVLAVPNGQISAEAQHVRDGWIAGWDIENETPVLWSPDGEFTGVRELTKVNGVSGNGDIIGTDAEGTAALYTADQELVTLEATADGSGGRTTAINAGGDVIIGADDDANGGNQSVVWRCA